MKITIPFLLIIALASASCKKYLYDGPISATYGSEFWTSQTAVEQATVAMYGQLRSCLRANSGNGVDFNEPSFFINGDLVSGTFVPAGGDVFLNYSLKASLNPPFNFTYIPYWEGTLQNWSRFYQLVAQSNLVLQNVPLMSSSMFTSEAVRNSYLAEALFMRAYTYFYMIRIWGDPVYVSATYNDVDYGKIPPIARTPEAMVLDSCIADLKKAEPFLSYSGGDPTLTTRANKGSLYALMAHIYAWKHDYINAHLACQQVINSGGYSLEPISTYTNIWKGKSSSESIFELPMTYNANDPNFTGQGDWAEAQFNCFATFLKGTIVDDKKSSCWLTPADQFIGVKNDDNPDVFFDTTKDARYKAVFKYSPSSGGDDDGYMLVKYANFIYQQPDTKTLPYINNNLVLFRLADIILLDAEALAYQGNIGGAVANLKLTEDRAGITDYQNPTNQYDMINEVVKERYRELTGEGTWFYDLIRTESTQGWLDNMGYPSDRVNSTNKGYYWPLDLTTLFPQDNLLTQNPWWATHK